MSDRLLRLAEELLRLEDGLLRLADRLVDNPIFQLSASLYFAYIQRVMQKLEDMAAFFLTSSLRTPKFFVKEFCYFLMPCHQHGLGINLLVQR